MTSINLNDWRTGSGKKSLAYFAKNDQVYVSKEMLEELKQISKQNDKRTARFCLHQSSESNLQDMIVIAYRDNLCRKLHKHTKGKEAVHMIEGEALALIFDENGNKIEIRELSANNEFAYRNNNGIYHIYFPLTESIVMREIRDVKNNLGETVFPDWDPIEVVKPYLPQEFSLCHNSFCEEPCELYCSKD